MCGLFTEGGCERNAQCSAWVNDPDCASAPRLDSDGTRMDIYTQVRAAWTFSCPRRPDLLCTRRPVVQPPPRAPAAPTCSRTRRMEVYAQVPHGDTCTQVLRLKILVIHGWSADRNLVDWASAPQLSRTSQRSNSPMAQRSVQRPNGPISQRPNAQSKRSVQRPNGHMVQSSIQRPKRPTAQRHPLPPLHPYQCWSKYTSASDRMLVKSGQRSVVC